MYNLVSFAGIFALMAVAWALSANRRVINWRVIIWGILLQFVFAFFIFVGGTAALVPKRTKDISDVGFRALIAATLATLMTAAMAGTFFTSGSILLGK